VTNYACCPCSTTYSSQKLESGHTRDGATVILCFHIKKTKQNKNTEPSIQGPLNTHGTNWNLIVILVVAPCDFDGTLE
jgi:hypothetical protein